MSDESKIPKSKRRWLRFSLRSFLILVTILSVWLAWYGYRVEQQRKAVRWVEENGGLVQYDFEVDSEGEPIHEARHSAPAWLLDLFGINTFAFVSSVQLAPTDVDDLKPLSGLKKLKYLDLSETQVRDLTPLSSLENLRSLSLYNTNVNDISVLTNLKKLRVLDLAITQVSDTSAILELEALEFLDLSFTQFSKSDLGKLEDRMPNCEIVHVYMWDDEGRINEK